VASLSGAFVATSGSAMFAFDDCIDRDEGRFQCSNRAGASKVALRGCRYPNIVSQARKPL
jgi:hypothetical protein